MRFTADLSATLLVAAAPPKPLLVYGTTEQRVDASGRPVFAIVAALFDGDDVSRVEVRTSGQLPKSIQRGTAFVARGAVANTWRLGDRSGVTLTAEAIDVASTTKASV